MIDEVFCQIIKQLTDNKSIKTDSIERGWKLLTILLNYFIPNEYLQPYVVKYLHENRNQNEKLGEKLYFRLNFLPKYSF